MNHGWLLCLVSKGMFSTELAVQYPRVGEADGWFVPREKVRDVRGDTGRVAVRVYRQNGQVWAMLPTEYGTMVRVEEGDLVTP
jgi:hypothetical protein